MRKQAKDMLQNYMRVLAGNTKKKFLRLQE
jgi:hypothetical protein